MPIYQSTSDIDYYNDDAALGNYQYVTLEQIVTDYMDGMHQDDYSSGTPRRLILLNAKRAFREFYYDVVQEIKAIELELSPMLTVKLPPDFVNYVRISWVDEHGLLHPMSVDTRMSQAVAYLQDNNYNLLYDNDGNTLLGDGVRDTVTAESDTISNYTQRSFCPTGGGFNPNVPLSVIFMNGKFRHDKTNGIIEFGSEVNGKNIVLEYFSDGLFIGTEGRTEADIRIHKFAEMAIHDYISAALIKNRKNVPNYAVREAKREAGNSKRVAKRRINTIRKEELLQAFRGSSRWIKS